MLTAVIDTHGALRNERTERALKTPANFLVSDRDSYIEQCRQPFALEDVS
jgi:hypothetical protein